MLLVVMSTEECIDRNDELTVLRWIADVVELFHKLSHPRFERGTCQILCVQLLKVFDRVGLVVLLAPQRVRVVVDRVLLVFAAVGVGVGLCKMCRCLELRKQRAVASPSPHFWSTATAHNSQLSSLFIFVLQVFFFLFVLLLNLCCLLNLLKLRSLLNLRNLLNLRSLLNLLNLLNLWLFSRRLGILLTWRTL